MGHPEIQNRSEPGALGVSILLGHSNSRIAAKHYNPWVKSRRASLEAEIEKAWRLN